MDSNALQHAVVAEYDPAWPQTFQVLGARLRPVLAPHWVLEHVGSTAVPGLAAKPIIDIDVVVAAPGEVPAAVKALLQLGYAHAGQQGVDGREVFRQPEKWPAHHLYVVVAGSPAHRDHVDLRDHLRRSLGAVAQYVAEKRRLAPLLVADRAGYQHGKAGVIHELLRHARSQGFESA